jgi:hypothetical protein
VPVLWSDCLGSVIGARRYSDNLSGLPAVVMRIHPVAEHAERGVEHAGSHDKVGVGSGPCDSRSGAIIDANIADGMMSPDSCVSDDTTVLYIGGEGRSGSTVLSIILGSYNGVISVGEFRNVWQARKANEVCGCGVPMWECHFWNDVGDCAFGEWGAIDMDEMLSADEKYARHFSIVRHALLGARRDPPDLSAYRAALGQLYQAIRQVSGSPIIIDSTKRASYAYVLRDVRGINLRVVHLVRDSRGVAYSNTKVRIIRPELANGIGVDDVYMPSRPLWRTAMDWEIKNLLFYSLVGSSKRRRVRYEDLVARPSEEIGAILEFAGVVSRDGGSWDDASRSFELRPYHTLGGNPLRFRRGRVRLEPDDEWRLKMKRSEKALVSIMTLPLLKTYGYATCPGWKERASARAH